MPIHEVKSRVRFKVAIQTTEQAGDGEQQRIPTRRIFDAAQERVSVEDAADNRLLFPKQRVPSTDELGDLLRSNISISLSAAKADEVQQAAGRAAITTENQHCEQEQKKSNYPSASILELRPLGRGGSNHHLAPNPCVTALKDQSADSTSANVLAATATQTSATAGKWRSDSVTAERFADNQEQLVLHAAKSKTSADGNYEPKLVGSCAVTDEDGDDDPPASLLATSSYVAAPVTALERFSQRPFVGITDSRRCVVINADECAGFDVANSPNSLQPMGYLKRLPTDPILSQKYQPTLLQRVVTLFAGRPRSRALTKKLPNGRVQLRKDYGSLSTKPNPPQPSSKHSEKTVHTASFSLDRPPPPHRRATVQFDDSTAHKPIPRRNLPLPPPILASRRPYRPKDEHLAAPFIEPAMINRYTGTQYVAPDMFEPAEVQVGFPSVTPPVTPTSPVRRQNSESELLDRDESVWAKWYAKYPTAEHLPFAKAYNSQQQGYQQATEQQVWDEHAARHAKFRKQLPSPTSDEDLYRQVEDKEHERADRLRYHSGHCFGALTGNVYPFDGGHII